MSAYHEKGYLVGTQFYGYNNVRTIFIFDSSHIGGTEAEILTISSSTDISETLSELYLFFPLPFYI